MAYFHVNPFMIEYYILAAIVLAVSLTGCNININIVPKDKQIEYADKYIDLHLHLDGAVTVDIARKLADLQGISLPESDEELKKMLWDNAVDAAFTSDQVKSLLRSYAE